MSSGCGTLATTQRRHADQQTMPQETELKLRLMAQDIPRLLAHPLLAGRKPLRQRLLNTYFDTPSLTLMQQRIAVRERHVGRRTLLTVKTAGTSVGGLSQRGEWEAPTRAGAFDFASLVRDDPLAQLLNQLAGQLVPLFRTDFIRRSWLLDFAGAQIEVALDQGVISTGHSVDHHKGLPGEPILELELELKQGPTEALLELAQRLALGPQGDAAHGIWLYPFNRSKAERGMALFLGERIQPIKAKPLVLLPDTHPVEAFQSAALTCLDHLQTHVCGFLELQSNDKLPDPEFIHQTRVALRRLRTGLRLFGPVLPRGLAAFWRARWQATASALGDARNWDVLATEVLPGLLADHPADDPQRQPLAAWVQDQRLDVNERAHQMLSAPGHALDVLGFTRALLALHIPRRQTTHLPGWARQQLRRQHARMLRQARRSLKQGAEGRHALRIELKKLRYSLGFLNSLLPPARARRSARQLTEAQQLLGELNDMNTARTLLATCPLPLGIELGKRLLQAQAAALPGVPRMEQALLHTRAPWN